MGTGNPEADNGDRPSEVVNNDRTYVSKNGSSPDSYRLGLGYISLGPLKFGIDSEKDIRAPIQNNFHQLRGFPLFKEMNIKTKPYVEIDF